jgi:hypothetical protein
MCVTAYRAENRDESADRSAARACGADLCLQTRAAQEAIRLTQLGARAGLVSQLTRLEKAVANRLYRQLHGRPSPPGQLPFSDSWYLKQNRRMAQATLVWQLSQRLVQSQTTPARASPPGRRDMAVERTNCRLRGPTARTHGKPRIEGIRASRIVPSVPQAEAALRQPQRGGKP